MRTILYLMKYQLWLVSINFFCVLSYRKKQETKSVLYKDVVICKDYITSMTDECVFIRHWWNNWQWRPEVFGNEPARANFPIARHTRTDMEQKPGLCGERLTTNCQCHGTAHSTSACRSHQILHIKHRHFFQDSCTEVPFYAALLFRHRGIS